jgi:hypothetical protein
MNSIDLLPVWAREAKARRVLIKILAVVQAVIFLLLIATVFLLNAWENQEQIRYAQLTEKLATRDPAPALLAEELHYVRAQAHYIQDFLAEILPAEFYSNWLRYIYRSTPENSTVQRIIYSHQQFQIIARTQYLANAHAHNANLTPYFTYVNTGRITFTDYGYTYEIFIFVGE